MSTIHSKYCIIITTCTDRNEAENLAQSIIKKRLAACVQLSTIDSFYQWEEKIHSDPEIRLKIKTKTVLYSELEKFIKIHHSYEVPEIICLPIIDGSAEFLNWIEKNTVGKT